MIRVTVGTRISTQSLQTSTSDGDPRECRTRSAPSDFHVAMIRVTVGSFYVYQLSHFRPPLRGDPRECRITRSAPSVYSVTGYEYLHVAIFSTSECSERITDPLGHCRIAILRANNSTTAFCANDSTNAFCANNSTTDCLLCE